ncbi:undecaprenyl-diphosphate phosphatase [Cyanobium sp. Morenito 9A2]|uniref:undecaprenyl-diphosphate phosphatase n=1 Tax=Cyanobium sp. Morenito 9A2 TaxID=2823718 RepID=UPI0020CCC54F|nr:undecaprenyl-diphosphate phosphatase [Cyanobium sp. Morenito 9A2]MCP9851051.1 undecaprenyl-diphosphate phosphatase [Cyanobium sp. Morenito 9A2]
MPPSTSAPALDVVTACWHYLVLGVVQGLTEFLPISSTAHLKVLPVLLGWGDPGVAVTAVIQLGSIVAVIGYFRADLAEVLAGVAKAFRESNWGSDEARLGTAIAIGTLPILVAAAVIKSLVPDFDHSPLRSISSIAIASIVMAVLLALAERFGSRLKRISQVRGGDGLLVGLAQALALIPGVSRSGSTLTASLFDGWRRQDAARFSFLLGIPAITLAGLVELKSALSEPLAGGVVPLLLGVVAAALVSWWAIAWLLQYLQKHSTWIFVAYRLVFGVLLLVWTSQVAAAPN